MSRAQYARQVRESYPALSLIAVRVGLLAAIGALSFLPTLS